MKIKTGKKAGAKLRHEPLGSELERPVGKLRPPRTKHDRGGAPDGDNEDDSDAEMEVPFSAEDDAHGMTDDSHRGALPTLEGEVDSDDDSSNSDRSDFEDGDDAEDGDMVDIDDGYVIGSSGLTDAEEALVEKFLHSNRQESRTLADIIMEKLQEKAEDAGMQQRVDDSGPEIPAKVVEVYSAVGKMLAHYRSGKLPKALKMLPHLRNWEQVLWLTRPDEWSPAATYASTRIFASNLNEKMAQRFLNLVLLEKCRDDIRNNHKLNYYYFLAIRKALYKPSAFYKGFLLPLAQSGNCTLREATIIGGALAKQSIPGIHSAAVLLRLAELPYSGSTSMFIKILLNKKYALPRRVIDALVGHFLSFERETRVLPVIWHQSLLVFVQRYKFEFSAAQREKLKQLARTQQHHQITPEVVRELTSDRKSV